MYQEFNQHKKSDAVKWIIAFTLIIVLMAGVVAALILSLDKAQRPSNRKRTERNRNRPTRSNAAVVLTLGQPRLMSVKSPALAADNTQQYVSQTVTATITPSTVVDKYVTWSVVWANDAPLKDKNISDYIKVTDDSQGNLTATVNCYKSFKGSKAILTCTTRQGGKTGTVNIVYEGVPSSMSITAPTGVTKYNLGKDSVDLLYVGKSYSLNLAMDNLFHSVGSKYNDFTVTVTGVGSVTCGTYSQSARGAGWSSHSNIVDFNKIAKEFVTCSTSGNTLSINVTKSLYDYYESKETKIVEGNGETTTYTNKLYSINTDSDGNKPYLIVKVQHKTLGFSAQYKFFIGEEVSKVTPSKTTITF
ncbi:MAG: hypothetical protein L6V79_07325 [Clostridium sp.]|nr:MAG: hypothetical protein L6V79_07325 [Clostridium sp.]